MSTTPTHLMLRIDARALAALFPEGTQARVELQHAVIAEFVRKNLKPNELGEDIAKAIESAKRKVADACFEREGMERARYGELKPNAVTQKAINDAVREAIATQIKAAISEMVGVEVDKLQGVIAHNISASVNRITDQQIREANKQRISALFEKMGQELL